MGHTFYFKDPYEREGEEDSVAEEEMVMGQ